MPSGGRVNRRGGLKRWCDAGEEGLTARALPARGICNDGPRLGDPANSASLRLCVSAVNLWKGGARLGPRGN